MRRAAQKDERKHGSDAKQFVERQFYVDDGLTSFTTSEGAIDVLTRTRKMLAESNLRLHKQSMWFSGPAFLSHANAEETLESSLFTLVKPEADAEIRPDVTALVTKASESQLGSQRFERF
ncbi:hypothetical protein KUCAC02_013748 [Chaenocephalus aceratus]|uniref:Uncharacterized protein n=1 Tax=Chaenocephalus aceratus TaxID=36190 RepID=A0ACB9WBS3_CHAAC|nr:hypothetical protein KUCAC02_013748 [Chaenocephalus aceratus]